MKNTVMEKILFISVCVRNDSRTMRLARHLLSKLEGTIEEVNLVTEKIPVIDDWNILQNRYSLLKSGKTDVLELRLARQFASADTIVIAAPYWDLAFSAMVKIYMEHVTVTGPTFRYSEESFPVGMCKARRMIYVMTSGGPVGMNFGYDYLAALCRNFFGIRETMLFKAENLDIIGSDVEKIMASAFAEIDEVANNGAL